jgi:predicted RNA polymerase sigma factor
LDFAEFYRRSADECLRAVLVSVGDLDTAQDLADEAFARAWASWRTVSRHPASAAWVVRTVPQVRAHAADPVSDRESPLFAILTGTQRARRDDLWYSAET